MATLTLLATDDAFNNNISGFYNAETFLLASSSSSSNANECDALIRFPAAGLSAGDTITAATLYFWVQTASDINGVALATYYADFNDVWGTLDSTDPPSTSISFGTTNIGTASPLSYTTGAWNSQVFSTVTGFPKNAAFNIGVSMDLGDVGPADCYYDDIENTNARSPYPAGSGQTDGRMFIVVTYTPAASTTWPGYVGSGGYY